jgi:hypothetical protein
MAVQQRRLKQLLVLKGTRVEVSEPFRVVSHDRYMCIGKVVGPPPTVYEVQRYSTDPSPITEVSEQTQTLCVISETGTTPEEARTRLLDRLAKAHDLPTVPPPNRVRRGWLARMITAFATTKPTR